MSTKVKVIFFVFAFALLGALIWMAYNTTPVEAGNHDPIYFTVEEGTGAYQIGENLEEQGIIKSALSFKIMTKVWGYGDKYKAGTYEFNKGMNLETIVDMLVNGETAGRTFTITEGQTIDKVADQLEAEGIINKKDFYYEVEHGKFDFDFMDQLPKGPTRFEGFLFPDTYSVPLDADAHTVINTMLKGFEQAMYANGLVEEIKQDGRSLYTIITEASIVQREAGSASEYANVASVIDNRLAIDMSCRWTASFPTSTKKTRSGPPTRTSRWIPTTILIRTRGCLPGPSARPAWTPSRASCIRLIRITCTSSPARRWTAPTSTPRPTRTS